MIKRFLLPLLAIGLLTCTTKGAMVLSIFDDGSNLIMTLTGTYDFSALIPTSVSSSGQSQNAFVFPGSDLFGWDAGIAPYYAIAFSGNISGSGSAMGANSVSVTTPIFFWASNERIFLNSTFPNIGTVNNTAVFNGKTLASMGMIVGQTLTASWQGDSAIIQVVPEPSTWALIAVGCVVVFWRLRRRAA